MLLARSQLIQSFHYSKQTLLRRPFSPTIDKLMFAATKVGAYHCWSARQSGLAIVAVSTRSAWQNSAFEGIIMDFSALATLQATESGIIEHQGQVLYWRWREIG
jgi:predicted YcjX-like family ATPase